MIHKLNVCLFFALLLATAFSAFAQGRIPFRLKGNLILVEATLNGVTGNFILDTGAPGLIVNDAHFEGKKIPWDKKEVVDFNGHASEARHLTVREFYIGEVSLSKLTALTVDLSSLEKTKGISLLGIIGHAVLKELEWVLDFGNMEFFLAPAMKNSFAFHIAEPPAATFDLSFSGHIPCLTASADGKKLRLGLDTGAEINLLEAKSMKHLNKHFEEVKKRQVKGITQHQLTGTSGILRCVSIENLSIAPLDITVVSLALLNDNLPFALDGILGMPFLKQGVRLGMDYGERKVMLWSSDGGLLVEVGKEGKK